MLSLLLLLASTSPLYSLTFYLGSTCMGLYQPMDNNLHGKFCDALLRANRSYQPNGPECPANKILSGGDRNSSPKSPEGRFKNYHISRHVHQHDIHYGQLWFHFQSIKAIHSYILHRAIQNSENWPQTLVFESGNASLVGFCSSPPEKPNWGVAHFHLLYQVLACRLWR